MLFWIQVQFQSKLCSVASIAKAIFRVRNSMWVKILCSGVVGWEEEQIFNKCHGVFLGSETETSTTAHRLLEETNK